MIDLAEVAALAIQAGAQIIGPLLWFTAGFIGALFLALRLLLFFIGLFE